MFLYYIFWIGSDWAALIDPSLEVSATRTQGFYDGSLFEVTGLGGQSIFVDTAKSTIEPLPALPFEVSAMGKGERAGEWTDRWIDGSI